MAVASAPFPHLSERARIALSLPIEERCRHVKNLQMWVNYADAKQATDCLTSLMEGPRIDRMPCILLIGASNNGKSRLLEHFGRKHPTATAMDGGTTIPFLNISAPAKPDEVELFINIISKFNVPYNPSGKSKALLSQATRLLLEYKVKVLAIDEFNQINTGTPAAIRTLLHRIRLLSKVLQMSVVAAGTEDSLNLLQVDPQFSTRFDPVALPRWEMGKQARMLLKTLEHELPFPEESRMDADIFASRIIEEGEKTIGGIITLVKHLTVHGITKGSARLTVDSISDSRWIRPSKRREAIHRLL